MNPIGRWMERRRVSRVLDRQLDWFKGSLQLLEEFDPPAAARVATKGAAILANAYDPDDPMAKPKALTAMTLAELKASQERLGIA